MILLLNVLSGGKIGNVELLQTPKSYVSGKNGVGEYQFETESDDTINTVLNNYQACTVQFNATKTAVDRIELVEGDYHSRHITDANWKSHVRPALMRAATTTNLFNN